MDSGAIDMSYCTKYGERVPPRSFIAINEPGTQAEIRKRLHHLVVTVDHFTHSGPFRGVILDHIIDQGPDKL